MRAVALGIAMSAALLAPAHAEPPPDLARAADLYQAAEAAMADSRFADALDGFKAAYELTRDPVLFYKLGSANEHAGHCEAALIAYRRYLAEAHPSEQFAQLTRDHIVACGGDPHEPVPPVAEPPPPPTPPPPAPALHGHGTWPAWLLVGGTLGLVTIGAVLAFATSSSESDIKDLYAGTGGNPPAFDATTQLRYQQLLDEGHRFEVLAWTAFGLAGAAAIGATILFVSHGDAEARIVPVVTPQGGGVSLAGHF